MFSHTSAIIVESRNRVGGKGTLVLAGATVRIAKFEDEGWSSALQMVVNVVQLDIKWILLADRRKTFHEIGHGSRLLHICVQFLDVFFLDQGHVPQSASIDDFPSNCTELLISEDFSFIQGF